MKTVEISDADKALIDEIDNKVKNDLPGADGKTILNALYGEVQSSLLNNEVKEFYLDLLKNSNPEDFEN